MGLFWTALFCSVMAWVFSVMAWACSLMEWVLCNSLGLQWSSFQNLQQVRSQKQAGLLWKSDPVSQFQILFSELWHTPHKSTDAKVTQVVQPTQFGCHRKWSGMVVRVKKFENAYIPLPFTPLPTSDSGTTPAVLQTYYLTSPSSFKFSYHAAFMQSEIKEQHSTLHSISHMESHWTTANDYCRFREQ